MSNINVSRIITAEDKLVEQQKQQLDARRIDCRTRIFAVCDEIAQINLASAASAGLFNAEQMEVYRAGLAWIDAMRTACVSGDWPDPPAQVVELASRF